MMTYEEYLNSYDVMYSMAEDIYSTMTIDEIMDDMDYNDMFTEDYFWLNLYDDDEELYMKLSDYYATYNLEVEGYNVP